MADIPDIFTVDADKFIAYIKKHRPDLDAEDIFYQVAKHAWELLGKIESVRKSNSKVRSRIKEVLDNLKKTTIKMYKESSKESFLKKDKDIEIEFWKSWINLKRLNEYVSKNTGFSSQEDLSKNIKEVSNKTKKFLEDLLENLPKVVAASKAAAAEEDLGPWSRNLFPDANLEELHTIEGLNAFIAARYAAHLGDEGARTVTTGGRIGNYMTPFKEYEFSKYQMMHSEATNFDCLIHSFLTATCPAFRRLSSAKVPGPDGSRHKNEFATWFRNYVFPSLPTTQVAMASVVPDEGEHGGRTKGEEQRIRIFSEGVFLADIDIGLLCDAYDINILSFEGQAGNPTVRITGADLRDLGRPVYMISNRAGNHFESVRTPAGSYTITGRVALQINYVVHENTIRESFGAMQDVAGIRAGVATYGIVLPAQGDAAALKQSIAEQVRAAKDAIRMPQAEINAMREAEAAAAAGPANVKKNSRKNYIQKRLTDPENGGSLLAAIPKADLEQLFGDVWNAAHKGGARRKRRNTRRKRTTRSKRVTRRTTRRRKA